MKDAQNESNSRERRHFTPQQKVAIVKRHLVDGVPISDLCDQHHLLPHAVLSVAEAALRESRDGLRAEGQDRRPFAARGQGFSTSKPSWSPRMRSSPS